MNGPLKWYGGKSHLANWIHSLEPADYTHRNIVFGGGLGEFWSWHYEGISETINDANLDLIVFYSVLRDPAWFAEFSMRVSCTPFSDYEQDWAKRKPPGKSYVDRAVEFFIRIRQSRQGLGKSFATPTTRIRRGMNENVSAWLSAVEGLPEVHERLKRVEIRNLDFAEFISKYDHDKALFYCDPPYTEDSRSTFGQYGEQEMTDADHERLLDTLRGIKGKFMLSGYPCRLYEYWANHNGWNCHTKKVDNHASSAKIKERKVEALWTNY